MIGTGKNELLPRDHVVDVNTGTLIATGKAGRPDPSVPRNHAITPIYKFGVAPALLVEGFEIWLAGASN